MLETIHDWSLYLMAGFYIFAGISHFRIPKFFLAITPKWVPSPEIVNIIVGVAEIILGVLVLIPSTRNIGLWGIIVLLVLVFPANVYHHQKIIKKGLNPTKTAIRLPIQALLIWWAYSFITW